MVLKLLLYLAGGLLTGSVAVQQQQDRDGKYWSYPFRKGLEIYNQDQLVIDEETRHQVGKFGLILVEGFFDVAKLVQAGCRNVGALMGTSISAEQIERLLWIRNRVQFPRIMLFLDRDRAGQKAAIKIQKQLERHKLSVTVFDWHQKLLFNGQSPGSIQDPADMTVSQLQALRSRKVI